MCELTLVAFVTGIFSKQMIILRLESSGHFIKETRESVNMRALCVFLRHRKTEPDLEWQNSR